MAVVGGNFGWEITTGTTPITTPNGFNIIFDEQLDKPPKDQPKNKLLQDWVNDWLRKNNIKEKQNVVGKV